MKFLLFTIVNSFILVLPLEHPNYYYIESGSDEAVNGCYKKTNRLNAQDYLDFLPDRLPIPSSSSYRFPIYMKTSQPVLYMMLQNLPYPRWIISSDENGSDVQFRRSDGRKWDSAPDILRNQTSTSTIWKNLKMSKNVTLDFKQECPDIVAPPYMTTTAATAVTDPPSASIPLIIGISSAVVVVIIIIAVAVGIFIYRRKNREIKYLKRVHQANMERRVPGEHYEYNQEGVYYGEGNGHSEDWSMDYTYDEAGYQIPA